MINCVKKTKHISISHFIFWALFAAMHDDVRSNEKEQAIVPHPIVIVKLHAPLKSLCGPSGQPLT